MNPNGDGLDGASAHLGVPLGLAQLVELPSGKHTKNIKKLWKITMVNG